MADEKDPIAEMLAVDDEQMRGQPLPEAELNTEAPADKVERERDEAGKFKGKEEAKEPAKEPELKKDEPKVEKPAETVPLAKYMEEKRALRAELEARDLTIKQINDRLAAFEKANAPKPAEAPDFVEDPKGYVDHNLKGALEKIAEANKKAEESGKEAKETAAQAAEQVQLQRFFNDLGQHEQRFVAQTPDYYEAVSHLRTVRAAQLCELVPDITAEQINQQIVTEERQLAVNLARSGRDPVATAYNLAKTFGYQPKAKEEKAAEIAKLPDPSIKRLPPDQTLGAGAGGAEPSIDPDDAADPINVALASLFRKRA